MIDPLEAAARLGSRIETFSHRRPFAYSEPLMPQYIAVSSGNSPEAREVIPGFWGLTPLANLAAHLALNRPWPTPASRRQPPSMSIIQEYLDAWRRGEQLRFPQLLLGGIEGRYSPFSPNDSQLGRSKYTPGSIRELEQESRELASALQIPREHRRVLSALQGEDAVLGTSRPWQRYRYETLACIILLRCCRRAVRSNAILEYGWIYARRPADIALTDETASYFGFNRFADCRTLSQGSTVDFVFCSGSIYRVPVSYLASWYAAADESRELTVDEVVLHPHGDDGAVGLRISDGRELLVSWDAVLMACEPEYECYGSFTEAGRRNIERWTRSRGPFRISADAGGLDE